MRHSNVVSRSIFHNQDCVEAFMEFHMCCSKYIHDPYICGLPFKPCIFLVMLCQVLLNWDKLEINWSIGIPNHSSVNCHTLIVLNNIPVDLVLSLVFSFSGNYYSILFQLKVNFISDYKTYHFDLHGT